MANMLIHLEVLNVPHLWERKDALHASSIFYGVNYDDGNIKYRVVLGKNSVSMAKVWYSSTLNLDSNKGIASLELYYALCYVKCVHYIFDSLDRTPEVFQTI